MPKFRIHWLAGGSTEVKGYDITHAMNMAGYGGGIHRAIDYYEEIKSEGVADEFQEKPPMKRFRFHRLNGKSFESEGYDVAHAFRMAGYSGGAIRALDYFEEISEKSKTPATTH